MNPEALKTTFLSSTEGRTYMKKYELGKAFNNLGLILPDQAFEAIYKESDLDQNNNISLDEFQLAVMKGKLHDTTLRRCFDEMDLDRSGYIDRKELTDACRRKGVQLSSDALNRHMKLCDSDNDGQISFDEFKMSVFRDTFGEDKIKQTFLSVDKDKSGFIEKKEFHEALFKLGVFNAAEDTLWLFKEFDSNKDGKIALPEFELLMFKVITGKLSTHGKSQLASSKSIAPTSSCKISSTKPGRKMSAIETIPEKPPARKTPVIECAQRLQDLL